MLAPSLQACSRPPEQLSAWLTLAKLTVWPPTLSAAVLLPMVLTVGYSFTDWDGFGPMTFVGLDNYTRAIGGDLFRRSRRSRRVALLLRSPYRLSGAWR